MATHQHRIQCSWDSKITAGSIAQKDFSTTERAHRSLKSLLILWLIAVGTAFIPILHFVLVPLFLFLGLFFAVNSWQEHTHLQAGDFTCPNCQKQNILNPGSFRLPKELRCSGCSVLVRLTGSVSKRDAC